MTELHPLSVAEFQQTILNPQLSPFARCLYAFMRAHSPKFKFSRRYLGKGMGVSTSPKKELYNALNELKLYDLIYHVRVTRKGRIVSAYYCCVEVSHV